MGAEQELRETRERAEHMKRSMRAASGIQAETQRGLESELQGKSRELPSAEEEVERLAGKCREAERSAKAAEARAAPPLTRSSAWRARGTALARKSG